MDENIEVPTKQHQRHHRDLYLSQSSDECARLPQVNQRKPIRMPRLTVVRYYQHHTHHHHVLRNYRARLLCLKLILCCQYNATCLSPTFSFLFIPCVFPYSYRSASKDASEVPQRAPSDLYKYACFHLRVELAVMLNHDEDLQHVTIQTHDHFTRQAPAASHSSSPCHLFWR